MKLAVCGGGPTGLEAAWHFHQMGADVTLFASGELGGMARRMGRDFPHLQGRYGSMAQDWEQRLLPLIQNVQQNVRVRSAKAIRVQKRFLGPQEGVEGRTRLMDLFRVVFTLDASEQLRAQIQENPESFKETLDQMGPEFLQSLKAPLEAFEDFDMVLDCRGPFQESQPAGPGGHFALNESAILKQTDLEPMIAYGLRRILEWKVPEDARHLVVVGDGASAALALLRLWPWAKEREERRLSVVTTAPQAFVGDPTGHRLVEGILEEAQQEWDARTRGFEGKMHEWRDLEPHVQAKIPRPGEPERKLELFTGCNVTSLDRLFDRKGLFATVERPEFRGPVLMRTLGLDGLVVATGHRPLADFLSGQTAPLDYAKAHYQLSQGLHPEPGLYTLSGVEDIPAVEKNILSYFSRA